MLIYGRAREMHAAVDADHRFFQCIDIADVGGYKFLTSFGFTERCDVKQADEGIAAAQSLAQGASDLPRCAGDKYALHVRSLGVCCVGAAKPAFIGPNVGLR